MGKKTPTFDHIELPETATQGLQGVEVHHAEKRTSLLQAQAYANGAEIFITAGMSDKAVDLALEAGLRAAGKLMQYENHHFAQQSQGKGKTNITIPKGMQIVDDSSKAQHTATPLDLDTSLKDLSGSLKGITVDNSPDASPEAEKKEFTKMIKSNNPQAGKQRGE